MPHAALGDLPQTGYDAAEFSVWPLLAKDLHVPDLGPGLMRDHGARKEATMRRGFGTNTRSVVMTAVLATGIAIGILSILVSVGPSLHLILQSGR